MNLELENFLYENRHYVEMWNNDKLPTNADDQMFACREGCINSAQLGYTGKVFLICSETINIPTNCLPTREVAEKYYAIPALLIGMFDVLFSKHTNRKLTEPTIQYKKDALWCSEDEDALWCSEDEVESDMLIYGGWGSWFTHPAIASYMLHSLRIAQSLMTNPLRDEFLSHFPDRGQGAIDAIKTKNVRYFKRVLKILRSEFTGWEFNWTGMTSELYWKVFDKLYHYTKNQYSNSFRLFNRYSGAIDWYYETITPIKEEYDDF